MKGIVEAQIPITSDFLMAVNIGHDFQREGWGKRDFYAEARFLKIFLPAAEPLK